MSMTCSGISDRTWAAFDAYLRGKNLDRI